MPQTYQKGNYNFTLFSLKSDTIRKKKKKKVNLNLNWVPLPTYIPNT